MSAVTQNEYTGNNSTTTYSFTFPYLKTSDIKASLDGVATTAFTLPNATTLQFNTAPSTGAKIKIFRETGIDDLTATFYAGSAIKSEDLNDNFTQNLYVTQEVNQRFVSKLGGSVMTGDLNMGEDTVIKFEGATDDAHETTLTVADPTADRTITLPNVTGTVVTTGDTGTVATAMIAGDAVNGTKIADDSIDSEHYVDGSIDTAHIANAQVTTAKIADSNVTTGKLAADAVTAAKLADNAVVTANIVDANVTTAKLAADAINGTKIADNSIDSEHYVDGSIDTAHLADNSVTLAKMADNSVGTSEIAADAITGAKIADNAIDSEHYTDASIDHSHLSDNCVDGDNIADDSINSEHYVDGSIDTAHIADAQITTAKIVDANVTTAKIAADAITGAKIADNQINSEHYVDGSIDHVHLANDIIDGDNIQDNVINSEHYVDGSIDTAHLGNTQVTDAKLASNSVITSKITDANVTTVKIADSNITLAKLASDLKQTSISDSDTQLPTSGAVVDYVAAQIAPLGGLEVIATDAAFPNVQPQAGVVISIADAGGLVVNGSGTSTTGRTVGGSTVTINNINSQFNNTTVDNGVAMMVSSTGSGQIYNYHKATLKEADLLSLSGDINDFAERYRVSGSAPTSSLDEGDLWWDSATDKLKVYDGSSWEEVASSGDFYINTISSYTGTGGNSATFNGTAYRFVLSNPGSSAQQHVVSINGVIQKPNSGTSQPSEGFVIDGSSIIFSNPPASGSDYFILTLGTTVSIGTPSNGTVTAAKIASSAVTTAKIADDAVTTAKIADDAVTGDKIATNLDLPDNNKIRFGTGNDLEIFHDGSNSYIKDTGTGQLRLATNEFLITNAAVSENMFKIFENGAVELYYDASKKFETTSSGVTVTGALATTSLSATGGITGTGGNFILGDNDKIKLGASQDLEIYHDGQNRIRCTQTGQDLYIATEEGEVYIQTDFGASNSIACLDNGAVNLYYDNSKKFETTSSGVEVTGKFRSAAAYNVVGAEIIGGATGYSEPLIIKTAGGTTRFTVDGDGKAKIPDNGKFVAGTGEDLQIYHDGSNSYITDSGTGALRINSNDARILNAAGNEDMIRCVENGAVEIYYDNSKKFETTSSGVLIHGDVLSNSNVKVYDNYSLLAGSGNDLQIYHNGSNSYLDNSTGALYIRGGTNSIQLRPKNDEWAVVASANGAVELAYDGIKKFETLSNGAEVSGHLHLGDNNQLRLGNVGSGGDLQIYHDGSHTYANNTTGIFHIRSGSAIRLQKSDGEPMVYANPDGAVELYYDQSKRLETKANGITMHVTGTEGVLITGATSSSETLHLQNTTNGGLCQMGMQTQDSDGLHHRSYIRSWKDGGNYSGILQFVTRGKSLATGGLLLSSHDNKATFEYNVLPYNNNAYTLGNSSKRWHTVYSNSSLNTSDKNFKNSIQDSDLGLSFINKLRPVSYKWDQKEGETADTKTHYGFIAQEVETAIKSESKTLDDYAGVFKPDNYKEDGSGDAMAIAIAEIVSPLVKAVQELSTEVETLKTKVAVLEAK